MNHSPVTSEEFKLHTEDDVKNHLSIMKRIDDSEEERRKRHEEVMSTLKPLVETYKTATQMGKWLMGIAVFISIMLGIILSLKSFIK